MATLLTIGPVHTLVQNTVYSLPSRNVLIRAQPITNILVSNDGTTFAAPTADAGGQFSIAAGYIKDTVGGALIKCAAA